MWQWKHQISFLLAFRYLPPSSLSQSISCCSGRPLSSFFLCVCKPQGICPCLGSPSCWSLRKVGPYNDSPEGIQGQVLRGLGLGSTHWGSIRMSILGRSSHAFILVPINIHFTMVANNWPLLIEQLREDRALSSIFIPTSRLNRLSRAWQCLGLLT